MKKILCILLILSVCLTTFCSCGLNEKPKTLGKSMDIPEDGVISESIFKTLKDDNKVIVFCGKSKDTRYEWTVFGSDIETPKDTNLKVEIIDETESSIKFKICADKPFGFIPTLSIYASNLWSADSATISIVKGDKQKEVGSATVTTDKSTIINFSVTDVGTFIVKADETNDDQAEKEEANATELSEQTSDSKTKSESKTNTAKEEETSSARKVSDGKQTKQDQYKTDPVPKGKPLPVDTEDVTVDTRKSYTCTISIECTTILNNIEDLRDDKLDVLPSNGIILPTTTVTFYEGESVFDVLQRVCKAHGIQMESSGTPMYGSAYVEGIGNLYEFDCGSGSGWMYRVNGWYPNYGCSRYMLQQGEIVEWRYTCDLGADIGGGYAIN